MAQKIKKDIPQLQARAQYVPESFNPALNTIDVVFATGKSGLREPYFTEPYYEELEMTPEACDMTRLALGASVLDNHIQDDLSNIIGVTSNPRIENGQGIVTCRLSKREDIKGIVQDIVDGIIKNVSVGYSVEQYERISEVPYDVNDPEAEIDPDEVPTYRAVKWTPCEVSFVCVPFDEYSQSRKGEPLLTRSNSKKNECTLLINEREAQPMEQKPKVVEGEEAKDEKEVPAVAPDAQAPEAPEAEEPMVDGADEDESADGDDAEEGKRGKKSTMTAAEMQAAEIKRSKEIRLAVRAAKLEESFADELIEKRMKVADARSAVLAKLEEVSKQATTNNNTRVGGQGMTLEESRREAATRVLLNQFNPAAFPLKDGDNEMKAEGLQGMLRKYLHKQGVSEAPFMSTTELTARGLHSTSDFPVLLANVANKSLMAAYEQAPSTFAPFVQERSVPNFKAISSVRLSQGGTLQKVNEHGEYKRGSLQEYGGSYTPDTFGLIIGATRKLLMNDDLGAFTVIPASLGLRARQIENQAFWDLIISNPVMDEDGLALFHATHKNLASPGTVISVASIGAGRAAMRSVTDQDGYPINISPSYIVTPAALEILADQYTTQITPNLSGSVNPFAQGANKLQTIAEPRLDANSTTAWYMFADKSKVPMVEIARVNGQGPRISTREGFDIDGMETKISYDFGIKILDWRGFYKNPGA